MSKNCGNVRAVNEKVATLISKSFKKTDLLLLNKADYYAERNYETIILSVLKNKFGFSAEQLTMFFKGVAEECKKHSDYENAICLIPEAKELKAFGVDIEALVQEVQNNGDK